VIDDSGDFSLPSLHAHDDPNIFPYQRDCDPSLGSIADWRNSMISLMPSNFV
jgi:hypothetical protein